MGELAFLDLLMEKGYYTQEQKKQIIVTEIVDGFLKEKTTLQQAHRVRTVMQNYYLFKRGAMTLQRPKNMLLITLFGLMKCN